jgi:hypothetical protein
LIKHVSIRDLILNTILFIGGLLIVTSTEYEMQRYSVYALNDIAMKYNMKISVNKIKMTAMKGKMNVRTVLVIIT